MGRGCLPPGFRFHPTDVELVKYYLKRKVMGRKLHLEAITDLDIYKHAPWDLPDKSLLNFGDLKWYFFCPVEKKYAKGARKSRATEVGYWKTTGRDRPVVYDQHVVGMIKTLVFHQGKAPKGDRTDWVMHEYRLEDKNLADRGVVQDVYVLCVVFKKDGPGPRNGAQYGAPFNEQDWSDDDDEVVEEEDGPGAVSSVAACSLNPVSSVVAAAESIAPETTWIVPSAEPIPEDDLISYYNTLPGICLDEVLPPVYERPDVPAAFMGSAGSSTVGQGDDISSMMDIFTEESSLRWNHEEQRFEIDNSDAVFSAALLSQPSSLENLNWSNIVAGTSGWCIPPKQSTTEASASLTLPVASEVTATASPTFLEALQYSGDDGITLMFSDGPAAALYP